MTTTTSSTDHASNDRKAQIHFHWLQRLDDPTSQLYDLYRNPCFNQSPRPHKESPTHLRFAQSIFSHCLKNDLATARIYSIHLLEKEKLDAFLIAFCHAVLTTGLGDSQYTTSDLVIPDYHSAYAYETLAGQLSCGLSCWKDWNSELYDNTLVFLTQAFWGFEGHSTKLRWEQSVRICQELSEKSAAGKENENPHSAVKMPLTLSRDDLEGRNPPLDKGKDVEDTMFNAKAVSFARERVVAWEVMTTRHLWHSCCAEARLLLQAIIFLRELRKCWQETVDDTLPTVDKVKFRTEYLRRANITKKIAFYKTEWEHLHPAEWSAFEVESAAWSPTRKMARLHELMAKWKQQGREKVSIELATSIGKDRELVMDKILADIEAAWAPVFPREWAIFEAETVDWRKEPKTKRAMASSKIWRERDSELENILIDAKAQWSTIRPREWADFMAETVGWSKEAMVERCKALSEEWRQCLMAAQTLSSLRFSAAGALQQAQGITGQANSTGHFLRLTQEESYPLTPSVVGVALHGQGTTSHGSFLPLL